MELADKDITIIIGIVRMSKKLSRNMEDIKRFKSRDKTKVLEMKNYTGYEAKMNKIEMRKRQLHNYSLGILKVSQ